MIHVGLRVRIRHGNSSQVDDTEFDPYEIFYIKDLEMIGVADEKRTSNYHK